MELGLTDKEIELVKEALSVTALGMNTWQLVKSIRE